jgi:hypothetical protein
MPNANADPSPVRPSGSPAIIDQQGCYQDVASWRRQQTLTSDQLDPTKCSAPRRELYKTGKPTESGGYMQLGVRRPA